VRHAICLQTEPTDYLNNMERIIGGVDVLKNKVEDLLIELTDAKQDLRNVQDKVLEVKIEAQKYAEVSRFCGARKQGDIHFTCAILLMPLVYMLRLHIIIIFHMVSLRVFTLLKFKAVMAYYAMV